MRKEVDKELVDLVKTLPIDFMTAESAMMCMEDSDLTKQEKFNCIIAAAKLYSQCCKLSAFYNAISFMTLNRRRGLSEKEKTSFQRLQVSMPRVQQTLQKSPDKQVGKSVCSSMQGVRDRCDRGHRNR